MRISPIALLLLSSSVFAGPSTDKPIHPMLINLQDNGYELTPFREDKNVPVIDGLITWQIAKPNENLYALAMTSLDQDYFFSGDVVDSEGVDPFLSWTTQASMDGGLANIEENDRRGENLIRQENNEQLTLNVKNATPVSSVDELTPSERIVDGDIAWNTLENTLYINDPVSEKGKRIVYMFTDPNCPNCAQFQRYKEDYESKGIAWRMVPVSFVNEATGAGKVQSIIANNNPAKAYDQHMQTFYDGGLPAAENVIDDVNSLLDVNAELMHVFGIEGTPTLIYQNDEGKTVMASHISLELLDELAGIEPPANVQ